MTNEEQWRQHAYERAQGLAGSSTGSHINAIALRERAEQQRQEQYRLTPHIPSPYIAPKVSPAPYMAPRFGYSNFSNPPNVPILIGKAVPAPSIAEESFRPSTPRRAKSEENPFKALHELTLRIMDNVGKSAPDWIQVLVFLAIFGVGVYVGSVTVEGTVLRELLVAGICGVLALPAFVGVVYGILFVALATAFILASVFIVVGAVAGAAACIWFVIGAIRYFLMIIA